ncbi:WAT1-related protein [Parasponia andersonii]|uniref:WAT1-related protein n=1 Tax=Parasponia andersonii TaxID=3476 RepID=A0A2P5BKZ6_PARAD|nr:WAT1-related protein [Parasponia andersonii]
MRSSSSNNLFRQAKLFCSVIFLRRIYAGLSMIAKFALNQGMSHYVPVVYRMAIASAIITPFAILLDRESRPKLTFSILTKTMVLSLFEICHSAMCNMLPAFAFLMAWIFRLEEVNIRRLHGQAKALGTIVTVGGAMILILVKGPVLNLPWTRKKRQSFQSGSAENQQDLIRGALLITASCICWYCFVIFQAYMLKSFPAELSLTALICILGLVEAVVLALVVESRSNTGILSGVGYYIVGLVIMERGPVFYTAFNPLSTIIVAILASIITAEEIY